MATRNRSTPSPTLLDVALAAFALLTALGPQLAHEGITDNPGLRIVGLVFGVIASLSLVWRRRNPLVVLAVIEAAVVVTLVAVRADLRVGAVPLMIAVYTLAVRRPRAESVRAAAVVAGINVAIVFGEYVSGHWPGVGDIVFFTAVVAGAWAVGDNVGTRRAYLAGLVERAERLERERETATQRAALEERARIARELHDVVAHHVSAIAVQAGAAQELATRDPQRAAEVLGTIRDTSRQALAEMRAIVGVLRETPDGALTPAPHLADLDQLAAQSRNAGLDVRLHIEGTPRPLPEALDLSAYRIVQEALTNSLKHAGAAHVEVVVRYGQDSVELVVEDDGRAPHAAVDELPGAGRGLVGMRERVALFHGRLELGRGAAGGFRVHAVLPLGSTAS
jgi:signal transduction histidine kinase